MPSRTELRKMSKAQLVDFACDFFEETGHLRVEMEALDKGDLFKLLIDNDADAADPEPAPDVVPRREPASKLDLGTFPV